MGSCRGNRLFKYRYNLLTYYLRDLSVVCLKAGRSKAILSRKLLLSRLHKVAMSHSCGSPHSRQCPVSLDSVSGPLLRQPPFQSNVHEDILG